MNLSTFDVFARLDRSGDMIQIEGERLERLQSTLSGMLADFAHTCDVLGIEYVLGGGTCLGAIRHGGFIPWDSDVDVIMRRTEYERFATVFDERLGDSYWLHDINRTPCYELAFPRMRKKGTVFRNRDDFVQREIGIYMDIFIMENVPDHAALRRLHGLGSLAWGLAWSCRRFAEHKQAYLAMAGDDGGVARVFKRKAAMGAPLSFASVQSWCRGWDRWNARCRDEGSVYVTVPVGRKHYFGELYRRSTFFPAGTATFDGMAVRVPHDCHTYLSGLYGADYMQVPPENKREKHMAYDLRFSSEEP